MPNQRYQWCEFIFWGHFTSLVAICFTLIHAFCPCNFVKLCRILLQLAITEGGWHFLNHHTSLMMVCPYGRWMKQKSDTITNRATDKGKKSDTITNMVKVCFTTDRWNGDRVRWRWIIAVVLKCGLDDSCIVMWVWWQLQLYCSVSLMTGGETAMMWNYFDRLCDWWTFFCHQHVWWQCLWCKVASINNIERKFMKIYI